MLVHFNHTQSLTIIFIEDGFYAGRFSGSRISKEQDIICFFSADKGFCILDQFLFLHFISYNVFKVNMLYIDDRINDHFVFFFFFDNAECLV